MKAHDNHAPIDELVAEYLRAEAATVDARALAQRVCDTRRRKIRQRRWTQRLAVAAALAIAVTLCLLSLHRRSNDSPEEVIQTFAQQTRDMAGGVGTVLTAIGGLRDAAPPVFPTFERTRPDPVRSAVDEWNATFTHDAAYVGGKMRASMKDVLDRAGLTL